MSNGEIAYRVRIGRLHRIHRGVYAVGHRRLTERALFIAAVLAIGDGAALSHAAAVAHYEFRPFPGGPIDVTVTRRVRSRPGIRLHCVDVLDPADMTWRRGIPVTTPARTLLDISRTLAPKQARRAVNQALVLKRVTIPLLYRQAAGPQGARLRALLADAAPTRSELEDTALEFFKRHGFQRPEMNARVAGFEVDCLWPERRLVIELDSRFHDNALARADDARKQLALKRAGFRVERLRWSDVTRDEAATAKRLCAPPTSHAA